jgi:uncharacterized cupin superfamily protein
MNRVNIDDVPEEIHSSPKSRYQVTRKHLSLATGGLKDVGVAGGGHPFDVELACIPPGKAAWLFHAHSSQWEAFIIISGTGTVRLEGEELQRVKAGDFIVHPPGECHQLFNDGEVDLCFYVIADNPASDVVRYPDSGKWFVTPMRKVFRDREAGDNIFEGEE